VERPLASAAAMSEPADAPAIGVVSAARARGEGAW
jgi:hypothetical protein